MKNKPSKISCINVNFSKKIYLLVGVCACLKRSLTNLDFGLLSEYWSSEKMERGGMAQGSALG